MTAEAFAPAKINLTLHVTGQRADGYHLLDSLVVFADIGDRLLFSPAQQLQITVTGPFAEGVPTDQRNLVWRAAAVAGWVGHITLEKNLPHGAGIGGGSSDAAAVLRTFGAVDQALSIGADVPVCLSSTPQRMRGIGEVLEPLAPLPELEILLVNPQVPVPTGQVFAGLTSKRNTPMPALPNFNDVAALCHWLGAQRNDLEQPARAVAPQIDTALAALEGALFARMSGSGATCFGLYERGAAAAAAAQIAQTHPGWWVRSGRVLR